MTKFQKIVLGIVAGLVVVLFFSVASLSRESQSNLGGVYNTVVQKFRAGFKAGTTDQLSVASTGAITTSANITATGTTSITGPMILGSSTNGLKNYVPVEVYAADTTLTAAQSGTTFITTTAGVDFTLPTPAAGVWYKVILSGNFATTSVLVQGPAADATDDVIYGSLEVAGAVVLCSAEDTISFVNTAELPGDWIQIESDGTKWYITGQAGTSGGITCTDAD